MASRSAVPLPRADLSLLLYGSRSLRLKALFALNALPLVFQSISANRFSCPARLRLTKGCARGIACDVPHHNPYMSSNTYAHCWCKHTAQPLRSPCADLLLNSQPLALHFRGSDGSRLYVVKRLRGCPQW